MKVAPPPPPVKEGEVAKIKGNIRLIDYYSPNLKIYMYEAYNKKEYRFVMDFDSPKLFRKVRRYVFDNYKKRIQVFGTWYSDSISSYSTKITDASQVTAV